MSPVHVHNDNAEVVVGNHRHRQSEALERTERTWVFDCAPECEERVLRDVEHSAVHAGGVPLTVDEAAYAAQLADAAERDVSKLARALSALARNWNLFSFHPGSTAALRRR